MPDFAIRILLGDDKRVEFRGPADITKESTHTIVNAANSSLLGGGGVDGAIHEAGGPSILAECRRIVKQMGTLPAGGAVITTGGRLTAKYVIHTVGPIYRGGDRGEEKALESCHGESIRLADEYMVDSLSVPAISTGAYSYPVSAAAGIAVCAVAEGLRSATHLKMVRFVLFDVSTLRAYTRAAESLRDPKDGSPYRIERSAR